MVDLAVPKKIKRLDEDDKELNELAQTSLEEASSLQMDLESLSKRMMTKVLSVGQEFMLLKRPLYIKRQSVLSAVPHFWAIAFMNHPKLKLLVDSSVEDCFNYLINIQVAENDDIRSGYQIVFTFDSNPYFYNCELAKQNVYEDGVMSVLKTNVDWKENMNLSSEKKMKERKRGPPVENFFDWIQRASTDKHDFVCDIIKDDLWLDPLKFFFMPDDGTNYNSESESEEEEDYDDVLDSNDDDSADDDMGDGEECKKSE